MIKVNSEDFSPLGRVGGWLLRRAVPGLLAASVSVSAMAQNTSWWRDIRNDRASAVAEQLRAGADPNQVTDKGEPALMQAVRDDAWEVFDVILADSRTDVNIMNGVQETPLMYTALTGQLARSQALVKRGAEVNRLGWTPLHYAAAKGHADVAKWLIGLKAIVNAPSPDGTSPLMMAMRANSVDTVQVLIDAGADPSQRNLQGQDAIDMAKQFGNDRLADAMEKLVQDRRKAQSR
ncbi:FOG: Ankyrin repeat [plant metagenome]|uniref:FOG: Ankyrin repeat n=1 Tax=plant metagenome TaxID=1297885 RepID=A0A484UV06_9ZZZZ